VISVALCTSFLSRGMEKCLSGLTVWIDDFFRSSFLVPSRPGDPFSFFFSLFCLPSPFRVYIFAAATGSRHFIPQALLFRTKGSVFFKRRCTMECFAFLLFLPPRALQWKFCYIRSPPPDGCLWLLERVQGISEFVSSNPSGPPTSSFHLKRSFRAFAGTPHPSPSRKTSWQALSQLSFFFLPGVESRSPLHVFHPQASSSQPCQSLTYFPSLMSVADSCRDYSFFSSNLQSLFSL